MKKKFKFIIFLFLVFLPQTIFAEEKLKIGLLVPLSGDNKNLGQLIIKSMRMALNKINDNKIEIIPKDTASNPNKTLLSATELKNEGVKIIIGPIFYKNLIYLNKIENVTFLSLTNKTINLPKNVISSGVNSTSQLNAIKKFLKNQDLKKTIILTPKENYKDEIEKGVKSSKLDLSGFYYYEKDPTKLTKQIEKITDYKRRKKLLSDEISRLENSDLDNKELLIKKLEKKYTLGKIKFDSVIIADFNESLKSVTTSLLYTDVMPDKNYFITLNQWFDESLLEEKNIQPIYYPSINKENLDEFKKNFYNKFNQNPNHLSLLSYDLLGLVYYLSLDTSFENLNHLFKRKSSFKGKIGIFDIKDNKIYHRLNFYKIYNGEIRKIF